jgi:homoserine kinase type II
MAVFTEVTPSQADSLMQSLNLGPLTELRGIEGGIENTNYFATTTQGEYVLTLFERLTQEQLPFYLYLMKHLAGLGIPVPDPAANRDGDILHTVSGKPAAVVNKLAGKSQLQPQAVHCAAVGDMLARMHLAGADYNRSQPNLRGLPWWNETVPVVLPYLEKPKPPCCAVNWPSKTTLPAAPLMPPCPVARCMPTCSATTSCSMASN